MKNIIVKDGTELSVKRLYLPQIISKCPKCGNDVVFLGDNYMSYPKLGVDEVSYSHCYNCDEELYLDVNITISVEYGSAKMFKNT